MDKLGRQARSAADAEEVANASVARSARAIGVFIARFLTWDVRGRARAEFNVRTAVSIPVMHAPIANPRAADKFHAVPTIRHASVLRGNDSPALASPDQPHGHEQQYGVDGRSNDVGYNPHAR